MKKVIENKRIDAEVLASVLSSADKAKEIAKSVTDCLNIKGDIDVELYSNDCCCITYSVFDTDENTVRTVDVLLDEHGDGIFCGEDDGDGELERACDACLFGAKIIGSFEFSPSFRLKSFEYGNLFVKEEVDLTPIKDDDIPF